MKPSASLLNLTPTSTALVSSELAMIGTADGFQSVVHGHVPAITETVAPAPADSMLPLSSIARVRIVADPTVPGFQPKLQLDPPCARCHVAPLSTDTSTPATLPPPLSVAVPLMVTWSPLDTDAPAAGE